MTQKHYDVACALRGLYAGCLPRSPVPSPGGAGRRLPGCAQADGGHQKANLVAAHAPDDAVTTHPCLLAALCQLLRERGAQVILGDSPGGALQRSGPCAASTGPRACSTWRAPGVRLSGTLPRKPPTLKTHRRQKTFPIHRLAR